ncbi:hypothetical protein ANO11243_024220 [Dothideomycetidae sp. 11243]|nr:hypothetical protein ANO11243_024220 [fungal sp. No.11243]
MHTPLRVRSRNYNQRQTLLSQRSPITRTSQPRSPIKTQRPEVELDLEQIIGTTCHSVTRFDSNRFTNTFAYVAGAAAVLAFVDGNLKVSQRFFRANASQTAVQRPTTSNGSSTPSAVSQDFRSRLGQRAREGSPFSSSNANDHSDSPGSSSGHARDKVKAATAVTLSNNGKWLAYGETGYRPRVLVLPITERRSTDQPSAIISEHSFGVHAVAFDSESRLLATLGTINDGFLYVWRLDAKTGGTSLMASNKCTATINQIAWIGRNLVTIGVRFVKVWRPDETSPSSGGVDSDQAYSLSGPGYKPLVGRNTLLGDMQDCTFSALIPLSETKAIVCSDAGDICLLDDTDKQQRLSRLAVEPFCITTACLLREGEILVAGSNGETKVLRLPSLERPDTPIAARCATPTSRSLLQKIHAFPVAIGAIPNALVFVDNHHNIHCLEAGSDLSSLHITQDPPMMASHADAIRGIRSIPTRFPIPTTFATWSSDGSVIGWTADGHSTFKAAVSLEQVDSAHEMINELKTVAFFPDRPLIITGDRYGVVRVVDLKSNASIFDIRAHSAEITDIAICTLATTVYVGTASRDRTIQIFTWKQSQLELSQTLDEHAGAVIKLAFTDDSRQLISCSSDRTVIVRDSLQTEADSSLLYTIARTINLKSAPTAMCFAAQAEHILVSAADRTINTINFQTGRLIASMKAGDNDGGDSVALSSLVHVAVATGAPLIAAVSSADKSVRVYSEDGMLLAREWGHTEGVADIALLSTKGTVSDSAEGGPRLVTAGVDGTMFIWSTSRKATSTTTSKADDPMAGFSTSSPLARPPLRKVISHTELSRLRRSMASPNEDSEPTTPTGMKSPPVGGLRKKRSRLSIAQGPRFETAPSSPISRVRSASPARNYAPTSRSPSRSPERMVLPEAGQSRVKRHLPQLGEQTVRLPHSSADRAALSREPSKEPESSLDQEQMTTIQSCEFLGQLKLFRADLEQHHHRAERLDEEDELIVELEALLRALKLRSRTAANRGQGKASVDTAGGGETVRLPADAEVKPSVVRETHCRPGFDKSRDGTARL